MTNESPNSNDEAKLVVGCLTVLTIFGGLAFYGWYSGGWEQGYEREHIEEERRVRDLHESLERAYQMSPTEIERARVEGERDAPIGQTSARDKW